MLLRITHHTQYDYAPAALRAEHVAYLMPSAHPLQEVLEAELHINPSPVQLQHNRDAFGNARQTWQLLEPHTQLSVTAQSLVRTHAAPELPQAAWALAWEAVPAVLAEAAQAIAAREPHPHRAAVLLQHASPHIPLGLGSHGHPHSASPIHSYAQESFHPGRGLLESVQELMQRIYRDFQYTPSSTEIDTSVEHVMQERRGVCQDFAHLMLTGLRSMGLAARYVSGYILSASDASVALRGADASHAWVSVYVPSLIDAGLEPWVDVDPTNARMGWASPGTDFVRLAVGRDYGDVSPLGGTLYGQIAQRLQVQVQVEPVIESAACIAAAESPSSISS